MGMGLNQLVWLSGGNLFIHNILRVVGSCVLSSDKHDKSNKMTRTSNKVCPTQHWQNVKSGHPIFPFPNPQYYSLIHNTLSVTLNK